MSSLQTHFSQPKTRKYVNTQNILDGEDGPRFFSQKDIDAWYAANARKINKIGDLYIIPGTSAGSTFLDVLRGDNGATQLNTFYTYNQRKTMTDMGKQITIGNAVESTLLTLRLVQTPRNAQNSEGSVTGYIPVENNALDLDNNGGRFMVRVARV